MCWRNFCHCCPIAYKGYVQTGNPHQIFLAYPGCIQMFLFFFEDLEVGFKLYLKVVWNVIFILFCTDVSQSEHSGTSNQISKCLLYHCQHAKYDSVKSRVMEVMGFRKSTRKLWAVNWQTDEGNSSPPFDGLVACPRCFLPLVLAWFQHPIAQNNLLRIWINVHSLWSTVAVICMVMHYHGYCTVRYLWESLTSWCEDSLMYLHWGVFFCLIRSCICAWSL